MPELPEVETIRADLAQHVMDKKITDIVVQKKRLVRQPVKQFTKHLRGNTITSLDRIGKLIVARLATEQYLLIHLKMTGQLIYQKERAIVAGGHSFGSDEYMYPNKYTYITFSFSDGGQLFFNDMRQFGYMEVVDQQVRDAVYAGYGIEPLQEDFTWANFNAALGTRTTTIKAALLNQKLFAGIGNIYADEICFVAAVKPDRRINTLTLDERKKLHKACASVIRKAIAYRGTTFNDYKDAFGRSGNFEQHLQVFGLTEKKCKRCNTGTIQKTRVAGRGTHFCDTCQL